MIHTKMATPALEIADQSTPGIDFCPFLDLPPEIRNRVYELVLREDDDRCTQIRPDVLIRMTNITRTCRQIRAESKDMIFLRPFAITCGEAGSEKAPQWLTSLGDRLSLIKELQVHIKVPTKIAKHMKANRERTKPLTPHERSEAVHDAEVAAFTSAWDTAMPLMQAVYDTVSDGILSKRVLQLHIPDELDDWKVVERHTRSAYSSLVRYEGMMSGYMFHLLALSFSASALHKPRKQWKHATISREQAAIFREWTVRNELSRREKRDAGLPFEV